jgi:hypothetical protein
MTRHVRVNEIGGPVVVGAGARNRPLGSVALTFGDYRRAALNPVWLVLTVLICVVPGALLWLLGHFVWAGFFLFGLAFVAVVGSRQLASGADAAGRVRLYRSGTDSGELWTAEPAPTARRVDRASIDLGRNLIAAVIRRSRPDFDQLYGEHVGGQAQAARADLIVIAGLLIMTIYRRGSRSRRRLDLDRQRRIFLVLRDSAFADVIDIPFAAALLQRAAGGDNQLRVGNTDRNARATLVLAAVVASIETRAEPGSWEKRYQRAARLLKFPSRIGVSSEFEGTSTEFDETKDGYPPTYRATNKKRIRAIAFGSLALAFAYVLLVHYLGSRPWHEAWSRGELAFPILYLAGCFGVAVRRRVCR